MWRKRAPARDIYTKERKKTYTNRAYHAQVNTSYDAEPAASEQQDNNNKIVPENV